MPSIRLYCEHVTVPTPIPEPYKVPPLRNRLVKQYGYADAVALGAGQLNRATIYAPYARGESPLALTAEDAAREADNCDPVNYDAVDAFARVAADPDWFPGRLPTDPPTKPFAPVYLDMEGTPLFTEPTAPKEDRREALRQTIALAKRVKAAGGAPVGVYAAACPWDAPDAPGECADLRRELADEIAFYALLAYNRNESIATNGDYWYHDVAQQVGRFRQQWPEMLGRLVPFVCPYWQVWWWSDRTPDAWKRKAWSPMPLNVTERQGRWLADRADLWAFLMLWYAAPWWREGDKAERHAEVLADVAA